MRLAFIGDISFTGIFKENLIEGRPILTEPILRLFSKYDYVIGNLEGPVTDSKYFIKDNGLVHSPLKSTEKLADWNIRVLNLANNHMFDAGLGGFKDTIVHLESAGCQYFGAGVTLEHAERIMVLKSNTLSVALIGFAHKEGMIASKDNPGVLHLKRMKSLKKLINKARVVADFVIVNYHGGEEFTTFPVPSRRKFARRIASLDCDLVVCHHSHVFQGWEKIPVPIYYSLGNFIFDIEPYRNKRHNNKTAILSCSFEENRKLKTEIIPVNIDLKKGVLKIDESNKDYFTSLSDFNNYFWKWQRDSYKAFFKSDRNIETYNQPRVNVKTFKTFNIFRYIFTSIKILMKKNKREVFIGAILYYLSRPFIKAYKNETTLN